MSKNKWVLKRHDVFRRTVGHIICFIFCHLRYQIHVKKYEGDLDRPYLILFNHQTGGDQFFVEQAFKHNVYFVATEDIFSLGIFSKMMSHVVNPIPIKKNAVDLKAVKTCIKVAKEGGTIAIAPEGNRTFHGKTVHMRESIVKLCKATKLPICLLRIEGGYGTHPRWSDVIRKGDFKAYVARTVEYDEYKDMPDDELFAIIKDGLYVDETNDFKEYIGEKQAEYLERLVYICPNCGLSTFESHEDKITCTKCGLSGTHMPNKHFNEGFPFKNVAEWYDYQEDFIVNTDLPTKFGTTNPLYSEDVSISEVTPGKSKKLIDKASKISLYTDRVEVKTAKDNMIFDFESCLSFSVLGKNKLNIYYKDKVYQIKGSKRFNAVKYMHFYFKYDNVKKGQSNDKFLGL